MAKIKDIAKVHSGITFRRNKKEESGQIYKVIQLSALDEFNRVNKNELTQSNEIIPKDRHLLQPGDIIFSSKGGYNFASIVPEDLGPTVAASTFLILKSIDKKIKPEYLAWYINSREGQDYLSEVRKRTSIPYVSKTEFVEMPVLIPSLKTQELIVNIETLKVQEQELRQALKEKRKKLIDAKLLNHINKKAPGGRETTRVLSNINAKTNIQMSDKKSNIEVVPDGSDWKVKRQGAERASRKFDNKSDAFDYGRNLAKKDKGELFIKNRDGKISDRRSYGNDPFPPQDKK